MCSLELYFIPHSSPCRAVLFTLSALDLEVKLRNVAGDENDEENLELDELCKVNPSCTLPTLVDNDLVFIKYYIIIELINFMII